jgi:hypothetical protein
MPFVKHNENNSGQAPEIVPVRERWEPTAREISDAVVRINQNDSGCNDGE